jgi:hypothetical protein
VYNKAKVAQLCARPLVDENVGGLDIAMHNASFVKKDERLGSIKH